MVEVIVLEEGLVMFRPDGITEEEVVAIREKHLKERDGKKEGKEQESGRAESQDKDSLE